MKENEINISASGADPVAERAEKLETDEDSLSGNVVEGKEDDASLRHIVQSAMYAGPLPPPQMLREYDEVLPGMADRIMSMAENEQGIRSRDNRWLIFNDLARILGSIVVSLGLVAGAIYCAFIDQPAVAIALAASGLIPQIIKYFNGKREK